MQPSLPARPPTRAAAGGAARVRVGSSPPSLGASHGRVCRAGHRAPGREGLGGSRCGLAQRVHALCTAQSWAACVGTPVRHDGFQRARLHAMCMMLLMHDATCLAGLVLDARKPPSRTTTYAIHAGRLYITTFPKLALCRGAYVDPLWPSYLPRCFMAEPHGGLP